MNGFFLLGKYCLKNKVLLNLKKKFPLHYKSLKAFIFTEVKTKGTQASENENIHISTEMYTHECITTTFIKLVSAACIFSNLLISHNFLMNI